MEAAGQMRACLQFFFHLHSKQFRLGWRSGKTDLAVNESCEWQVVKEIGEILPDVGVSVLAQALIVEAVHLRYLAALVIPAQNRDAVFEPNLTHKHKSIDWGLTALSARIRYIVPLINMLQLKVKIIGEN